MILAASRKCELFHGFREHSEGVRECQSKAMLTGASNSDYQSPEASDFRRRLEEE